MTLNNLHSKVSLPEKSIANVFKKNPGLKDVICVLSYKKHTHPESVRLLILDRDVVPLHEKRVLFMRDKQTCNESFSGKDSQSADTLDTLLPFKAFSSSYSFNCVPLPSPTSVIHERKVHLKEYGKSKTSRWTQYPTSLFKSREALSTSVCRKRIQKEKALLLIASRNPIWADYQRFSIKKLADQAGYTTLPYDLFSKVKYISRDASGDQKRSLNMLEIDSKKKVYVNKSKSIWKTFTNTLMRNGNKLRYQSMLRKALLMRIA